MDIAIRLVGRPSIERNRQQVQRPRGHRAWAVLADIERADRPVPRQQLAELLFGDADDIDNPALQRALDNFQRSATP